ncbi:hypothetical protein MmTuc01_0269 [Methanosarcina mazei Tuc01]|uniref:Uncharacterized protein n=1 Tax=Methanosarcina mazei Tuc01 TaxID=1236903 RepID=M1Q6E7_METMZ|nr:hypothetical protein MmTuc01_0269 [Methanosarcina mazei Tuc01]
MEAEKIRCHQMPFISTIFELWMVFFRLTGFRYYAGIS